MSDVPEEIKSDVEKTVIHVKEIYSTPLGQRLVPGCGLAAVFEPKGEERTAVVTTSNKILLQGSESPLNMRDKVRCITSASFGLNYDYIIVGTESQVLVYDIYNNITIFQRDVPDGVNCFAVGALANREPAIYCGGNCAIWGFDQTGKDVYWTVTGDSVISMCLCDYDQDKENELIIGSPDHEIRIFKDDLMRKELMETDSVLRLVDIGNNCFAYGLANGTLGVYRKEERLWRIKSKHIVIDLLRFPVGDGIFTSVWDNGKKDIRTIQSGDQLASVTHEAQVVAAFTRNTEEGLQLVTASAEGMLDGYSVEGRTEKIDKTQETLREFGQQKHNLLMELSNFEAEEQMKESDKRRELRIPANTAVDTDKEVRFAERTLILKLKATNDVCIRAVVAFAEGMFDSDSYIWIPDKFDGNGDEMILPLLPEKDSESDLSLRIFLGHLDADRLFLFESCVSVPRFSRFLWITTHPEFKMPANYVESSVKIRPQRVVDWIHESFTVITEYVPEIAKEDKEMDFLFIELAPKKELSVCIRINTNTDKMTIFCDCMETTGAMLQSLATFMNISAITSLAHFPKYFEEVDTIVEQMDELYEVQTRLTTELSSQTTTVKEIIVRAEDVVFLDDMEQARKYYSRLKIADGAMRQALLLKHNHHERMVKSLRRLNKIIEYASKLRVGPPGRDIVSACREAIREDNKEIIVKVLQYGAKSE